MRDLKFRVLYNRTMIVKSLNDLLVDAAHNYMFLGSEIMQYTGLKDKHDKEIYEGDIVRYTSLAEYGLPATESTVAISWGDEVMGFDLGFISHHLTIYDDIEVIGNIYEHPELLKGKE